MDLFRAERDDGIDLRRPAGWEPRGKERRGAHHNGRHDVRRRIVLTCLEEKTSDKGRGEVGAAEAADQAEHERAVTSRTMVVTTCLGRAPSAMRTPISPVRRATAYAVMLKIPTTVRSKPNTPTMPSNCIRRRGVTTLSLTNSPPVRMRWTTTRGPTACAASRNRA